MPIKFRTEPHYLSAASHILTWNPMEGAEAGLPLGLCVRRLTGAGICDHREEEARPSVNHLLAERHGPHAHQIHTIVSLTYFKNYSTKYNVLKE